MKKILTSLLIVSMLASTSITAFAAGIEDKKWIESEGYEFKITESIDIKNRVIRTFERNSDIIQVQHTFGLATQSKDDYAETKALLLAMGMEQDFIDMLSEEDLEVYATSPSMHSTVAYSKTDAENNVTYLEESVAIEEAAEVIESETFMSQVQTTDPSKIIEDSYMRNFFMVTYLGNATYQYTSDARWLTMPYYRGTDSNGSCAQNGTVINTSKSGWYTYDKSIVIGGNITKSQINGTLYASDFQNAINGNWYGAAATFNLPDNCILDNYAEIYSNYKVHCQYNGTVNYPRQESYFNATSTYDHSTLGFSGSPNITIGLDGVSGSIGLSVVALTEGRTVELDSPIHYVP